MKKFLFILSAAGVLFFTACESKKSDAPAVSDKAKKNLDASHIVNDAFKTGDISKIDSGIASDFVDHTDKGDMGRDSLKAMITHMHATPNDMKMEIVKEFADDDYVFSWVRFTGTSDGSMGPKGPYDMKEIEVIRFTDGKAVEHWAYQDYAAMMKMMQAQQPPMDGKMKSAKDTASK